MDQKAEDLTLETADNEESQKRSAFGNRFLTSEENVFKFNAWYVLLSFEMFENFRSG
jgi:hypothetical protein